MNHTNTTIVFQLRPIQSFSLLCFLCIGLFFSPASHSQDDAWFLSKDPNISIPFMENIGIYGNLFAQTGARARILGGSAWPTLPDIEASSNWLSAGDLIYGGTPASATEYQWYYLYSPSSDDVIPGAEWRPIASLTETTTVGVIEYDPTGAEKEPLDESWAIPDAMGTYQKITGLREVDDPYSKVYAGIRNSLYSVSIDMGAGLSPSDYAGWVQKANYSETIGSATNFTINHNQNCYPLVQIAKATGSHEVVYPLVQYVDANNITVKFPNQVIAANSHQVNVLAASGTQTIGDGVETEFGVTTSTATRNCFVQVWETAGYGRLIYAGIAYNTIDSITVAIFPAPETDEYTVSWGIVDDDSADFTSLFVMLDGSNRGSMTGTHGNTNITIIANNFQGDGSELTDVHATYLRNNLLLDVAPTYNNFLIWSNDGTNSFWTPSPGFTKYQIFYVNGQVFYPGFLYDSFRFNFGDGLSMGYTAGAISEVTINVDPTEIEEFVLKSGDKMSGTLHMQDNHLTGVNHLYVKSIFADQVHAGQSINNVTKFMHDFFLSGTHNQTLNGRFSNIRYIDGIIVQRQPVFDAPIGSFMPYNAGWYGNILNYPGGIDDIYFKKAGDTFTGTVNGGGQSIHNATKFDVRSDGQVTLPAFDAANAPDPASATQWFYNKLPERGVGLFKQTSVNWFYGVKLDSKLYLQKMLTEAEMFADTEARVHHMTVMATTDVARYVYSVTRWPT